MKRTILYILTMLLALPAAFSCDAFIVMDTDEVVHGGELSLVITGTVSDKATDKPLEGIRIAFSAYPKSETEGKALSEKNVYTDNNGVYTIEADGFHQELTCIVTASCTEGRYAEASHEVEVPFSGVAFDNMSEAFVVNDCDFKLSQAE